MTWQLEYTRGARRFLDKLQKDVAVRLTEKLRQMAENPFRYLKHFEGKDVYKVRIGDYRALISVDLPLKILTVRVLDKRSRIYKRQKAG